MLNKQTNIQFGNVMTCYIKMWVWFYKQYHTHMLM